MADYLTIPGAAEFLGFSKTTIVKMLATGVLVGVRFGKRYLIKKVDLENIVQNGFAWPEANTKGV